MKRRFTLGVPLAFATDGHTDADTIRITWPNGLIQNEPHQKLEALTIPEAQRLSGSCPMIFTWDGAQYQFITDVLGVGVGGKLGRWQLLPGGHDQYIQIPGRAEGSKMAGTSCRSRKSCMRFRTLDQVQLIAVDHPAARRSIRMTSSSHRRIRSLDCLVRRRRLSVQGG